MSTCQDLVTKSEFQALKNKVDLLASDLINQRNQLQQSGILSGIGDLFVRLLPFINAGAGISNARDNFTNRERLIQHQREIDSLKAGDEYLIPLVREQGEKVERQNTEILRANAEIRRLNDTNASLRNTIDNLNNQLNQSASQTSNIVEQSNSNFSRLSRANSNISDELARIRSQLNSLSRLLGIVSRTGTSDSDISNISSREISNINNNVSRLSEQITGLQQDNLRLKAQQTIDRIEMRIQAEQVATRTVEPITRTYVKKIVTNFDQINGLKKGLERNGSRLESTIRTTNIRSIQDRENYDRVVQKFAEVENKVNITSSTSTSNLGARVGAIESTIGKFFSSSIDRTVTSDTVAHHRNRIAQIDNTLAGITTTVNEQQNELERVINLPTVNSQQLQQLDAKIAAIPAALTGIIATQVSPSLNQIKNQTSPSSVANAAATGVCNTSNPGGCLDTKIKKPILDGITNNLDAINLFNSAGNTALNNRILGVVNRIDLKMGEQMVNGVTGTMGRLYNTLKIDRWMNIANTALTVHNAAMLSNNLGVTAIQTMDLTSQAIGLTFPDENGAQIGIGTVITDGFTGLVQNAIGLENYTALGAAWAKANRIYQASVNVLDTTYELFDSGRALTETIGENTGKIGNALLDAAAVPENAYQRMVENITPLNAKQAKFERFRNGLETISAGVSSVNQISSEVIDTRDQFTALKESWDEWESEVETKRQEKIAQANTIKQESQTSASISKVDFSRDETTEDDSN